MFLIVHKVFLTILLMSLARDAYALGSIKIEIERKRSKWSDIDHLSIER